MGAGIVSPHVYDSEGKTNVVSYGVTSYGYDVRIADEFLLSRVENAAKMDVNVYDTEDPTGHREHTEMTRHKLDPKRFDVSAFDALRVGYGDALRMPPHSFALGKTVETLDIPRDIIAVCVGKSTYARCGIIVNVTPLEPEWRGTITVEISNTTPYDALIHVGEASCR